MTNIKKLKEDFSWLSHENKLAKIMEILSILAKKSSFFKDLHNHYKTQKDVQENALDAIYFLIMNIAEEQNK